MAWRVSDSYRQKTTRAWLRTRLSVALHQPPVPWVCTFADAVPAVPVTTFTQLWAILVLVSCTVPFADHSPPHVIPHLFIVYSSMSPWQPAQSRHPLWQEKEAAPAVATFVGSLLPRNHCSSLLEQPAGRSGLAGSFAHTAALAGHHSAGRSGLRPVSCCSPAAPHQHRQHSGPAALFQLAVTPDGSAPHQGEQPGP